MPDPVNSNQSSVTQQWNENRSEVHFILTNNDRKTVDKYIDANLDILQHWDKSQTLYTLQDVSHPKVTLTPYLKNRLNELTVYIKSNEINVRTAVVLSNDLTGQLIQVFGRIFTINARYLRQAYFIDRQKAEKWLIKQRYS